MADLDIDTISKLRVRDLREHLSHRGLSTSGLKADLVKRLRGALEDENTEDVTAIQSPEEAMNVDEPTNEDKQTSEEEDSKTEDEENMPIEENSPVEENMSDEDGKLRIEGQILSLEEHIKVQEIEKQQVEENIDAEAELQQIEYEYKARIEKQQIEDEKKAEIERQQIEEEKKAEERRQIEEEREAWERQQIEEERRAEEKRKIEEERKAEEMQKIEEERKAEEMRKIEEERKAEEMRKIEEERKAEERRQIEEERKAEERRQIEEERKAEERRQMEEERKAEERRQIEEEMKAEERRRIEEERKAEERRQIERERKAEAKRQQIENERKAEAERQRIEDERKAEAERQWIENERKAEIRRQQIEERERLEILEEKQKAEAKQLHIEEQRKAEAERLKFEEERKRIEVERLQIEEERKIEAERLQVEEEKKLAEADKLRVEEEERIRYEEERRKAEKLKMEEEIRKTEKLRIEEEKRKAEEERKQAEEKRDERRRADERIREEKRIAAAEEKRKAEEEEMKKEQERWLVEEQMRHAQEEHKKRLQAEEQKRVLEEQQRLMEEELERQQNEQQLYKLQQKAMLEQESQDFNVQSDINTNSFQSNSNSFVSIPTTINIMPPPPPSVLLTNIPPPPSMIPSSHTTITPSVQVSAPPTRFGLPHSISIPAPPTPIQPFVAPLEKKQSPKSDVDLNDSDAPESMDTTENATDIRLPQALEKVLALKTERAQLLGIDPDSVVQPIPPTEERVIPSKTNVVTLVSVDEDEYGDEDGSKKKESKSRRRKKKKKKSHHNKVQLRNEINKHSESQKSKENIDIDIDYVQEVIDISDPLYSQFMKIFEKFKLTETEKEREESSINTEKEANKEALNPMAFRKKPVDLDEDEDDEDQDEDKKEEKPKLSKRKLKKLSRMTVAELKQKVGRPELVEMHDVTAKDPVLLLHLKASRNTVPVPRHWCFKRKYLQGKRGIEKPAFELPDFIKRTGIMEMRQALQEKEDQKTMKAKMRERVRPKLGKIDIDYQKLHDAFFKWQTKPRMTIHGDLYYEGKEFETRLKEKKPGDLSEDLRTALGMPTGPNANKCPPPWLIAMQRYGPPPSYPNLKIPGLNAPIPDACSFGYHAGGWGKPPVDETGRPLYGDVFGTQMADNQPNIQEEEIDHTLWGELESESSEEEEEEEEDEEEEEEEKQEDETGLVTPAEGLITPSGFSSIPAGMETPDMIELRKRKIEAEKEGGETPALYTILPEKKTERIGAAMMGSTHIYDLAAAIPASKLKMAGTTSVPPQGVEVALDPSELEMDSAAMAARYEQTMREQQSHLEKEDLSDMVAEHAARQKNKRKKQQLDSAKPPKKYKEFKF